MTIQERIQSNIGTIVDVRTVSEFNAAHVEGSINIPLNEIEVRLEDLKDLQQPLLLCCLSGGRSGQAQQFLSRQGIECYNVGGWASVEVIRQKKD